MQIIDTDQGQWRIPDNVSLVNFDLNWRPNPRDHAYIHQFGTQWQRTGGPQFVVTGATQIKYRSEQQALKLPEPEKFKILINSKVDLDWSWHPDDTEPEFIWVFGNQYLAGHDMPTVEYTVGSATQRKYVTDVTATMVSDPDHWKIHKLIDETLFDFSWHPHPWEPPYIYVWGNQYLTAEQMPTVEYHQPGATERKYMHDRSAKLISEKNNWVIHDQHIFPFEMDAQWAPHPWDPAYNYVWGNKWIPGELKPTIEYRTPGATENKYMGDDVILFPEPDRWRLIKKISAKSFDFTWRPDPREPPYIYVWGNQYLSSTEMPTVEYHVPGATDRKYMHDRVANLANNPEYWVHHDEIVKISFDWTWAPHPHDPAYIYVWGNRWVPGTVTPTLEYHVPGATERKYMPEMVEVEPHWDRWRNLEKVVNHDYSWRPDPTAPPYIYVWGNKWVAGTVKASLEYHCSGATERKYMTELVEVAVVEDNWKILIPVVKESFDFSWRPEPDAPVYTYVWGNRWNDAETEATIEYYCEGATERKYMHDQVPELEPTKKYWTVNLKDDLTSFDFTWRPNPHSPPQIYQWEGNGPTYTVPGATAVVFMQRDDSTRLKNIPKYQIKTSLEDLISEHADEVFWALNPDLNYQNFNFKWSPDQTNFRHINIFGNAVSKNTQTYYINGPMYTLGHRDINYVEDHDMVLDSNLSMFWVDMGSGSHEQFTRLQERFPQIQKTRFLNSWVDTISRCAKKTSTKLMWILSSDLDYSEFEFDFYPAPWQMTMVHVFGTQWSHWGTTYLINSETFNDDTRWVKVIEHLRNINHVRSKKAKTITCQHDILYIDHGNLNGAKTMKTLDSLGKKIYHVDYELSYLNTIKTWIQANSHLAKRENYAIWVASSVMDYDNFDFTWQADPFQTEQLHVFASEFNTVRQKFGDTFRLNVSEFSKYMDELTDMERYEKKVNYIEYLPAQRLQHPQITHTHDSQAQAIKEVEVNAWPYYELVDQANCPSDSKSPVINLWDTENHTVTVATTGASRIIVPRVAMTMIKDEIYDYPHIVWDKKLSKSKPLDIIFISNGEPVAESNYQWLLSESSRLDLKNKMTRVQNVDGRVASQRAAATVSDTNWYFLVNGKVKVSDTFDWSWQPDRLQLPKHYIFNVENPVNGLCYGHQAIVANNKQLTLNTVPQGLDFTLDSLHEVVDVNCGVAMYNTDAWTTWRTAFREAIKLRNNSDEQSSQRLDQWLSPGQGEFAEWSQRGAQDGVAYHVKSRGKMEKLMLSYDWAWIQGYFNNKYNIY